ncbi:hypothetical protein HAX54_008143 [Datura stramonium]|uniref:BHLH domain-containing protein n=1 Tax=Datura stramonium TaxID=4076 RepID=A0ABS8RVS0_DATST|nr:hypothetical protein [Datura stramonium]
MIGKGDRGIWVAGWAEEVGWRNNKRWNCTAKIPHSKSSLFNKESPLLQSIVYTGGGRYCARRSGQFPINAGGGATAYSLPLSTAAACGGGACSIPKNDPMLLDRRTTNYTPSGGSARKRLEDDESAKGVSTSARREKISERMKVLQDLVPGCNKFGQQTFDTNAVAFGSLATREYAEHHQIGYICSLVEDLKEQHKIRSKGLIVRSLEANVFGDFQNTWPVEVSL